MTIRNTVVNNEQTSITFTQDTSLSVGTDKRRWCAEKDGDRYVFWRDGLKIFKQVNSEMPTSSPDLFLYTTSAVAMCIDKDVSKVYVIEGAYSNFVRLHVVNIVDMTKTTTNVTYTAVEINPLKAQLTPNGDKIVWLGSNNTFYKMNLDGGNLTSVEVALHNDAFSFTMTKGGIVYIPVRNGTRVDTGDMSTINLLGFQGASMTQSHAINHGGFVYMIGTTDFYNNDVLYILDISDNSISSIDLTSTYGIAKGTTKKFNLAYNGTELYGILCENNGSDRKYMWKVDLDTLSLQGLREVSKINNSGIKTLTAQWGNSGTMATIDTDGANDDWTGCDRVTVFS